MTVSHVDTDILIVIIIVLHAEERSMPQYNSRNKFIYGSSLSEEVLTLK